MTTPAQVSRYDLYDLVRLVATTVASDGVTPADASTMQFLVRNPSGSVATYTGSRTGVGAYIRDITVNVVGSWYYRGVATGGAQANEEWTFIVDRSQVI